MNGGETSLATTLLLCRHHHRLVHEGGWSIRLLDDGIPVFVDPRGGERFEGGWQAPRGAGVGGGAAGWEMATGTAEWGMGLHTSLSRSSGVWSSTPPRSSTAAAKASRSFSFLDQSVPAGRSRASTAASRSVTLSPT